MVRRWVHILLLFTACSSQAGTDSHTFAVREEEGVAVARTSGGPKHPGELFTYERELVLDTEQSEDALLYRPTQFLADETGTLYINDTGLSSIVVYDAEGRYSHRIGRPGRGPGEATYWRVERVGDGILQVYGEKERRTTRFATDGTFQELATLPPSVDLIGNTDFILLPAGRRLILTNTTRSGEKGMYQRWGAVIFSSVWDTIGTAHTPWILSTTLANVTMDKKSAVPLPIAFGPRPSVRYHPAHGIVLSLSDRPELRVYDLEGRLTRRILVDRDLERVTDADRDRYRQALREGRDQMAEKAREMVDLVIEHGTYAEQKASWGTMEIDAEGYFWLDLDLLPETQGGRTHTFMVLSPEGEYLGTTARPYRPSTYLARGRMYVLEEDLETGMMLPTVYTITPAVPGLRYPD